MSLMEKTSDLASAARELGAHVRLHEPRSGWPPLFIEQAGEGLGGHAAFIAWLKDKRPVIDRLIVEHGGVVLRGFPIASTEDFEDVIGVFPAYRQGYVGGASPRKPLGKKALESTYLASHYRIAVHQEMAYARDMPPRIMFFGRVIADEGGETIIADMRKLTDRLPADLAAKLEKLGVCSVRNYGPPTDDASRAAIDPDFVPWTTGLGTEDRAEAERVCASLGREAIWNANGGLTTVVRFPAFAVHPVTGQKVYRTNFHASDRGFTDDGPDVLALRAAQAHATGAFWGDGSELTAAERAVFASLCDEVTVEWPWQAGDVMILDNLLVAHGRNPFKGNRETQVALLS